MNWQSQKLGNPNPSEKTANSFSATDGRRGKALDHFYDENETRV